MFDYVTDTLDLKLVCSQLDGNGLNPSSEVTVFLDHCLSLRPMLAPPLKLTTAQMKKLKSDLITALPQWKAIRLLPEVPIRTVEFD